ncbi:MAG: hypothetical protein ACO4CI_04150, partial [Phycisphaerales bacterium]
MTTSDAAPEPRRFTLPCGLPVVIEPMPSCASVAVSWLLPLGDSGDDVSRQGEAAILSELALRGCGDLDSREGHPVARPDDELRKAAAGTAARRLGNRPRRGLFRRAHDRQRRRDGLGRSRGADRFPDEAGLA